MKQDIIPLRQITGLARALDAATEPAEIIDIEAKSEAHRTR